MRDTALEYLRNGLCVLPAFKEQKRPTLSWKVYEKRLPTEEEWKFWYADALCIVCGAVSGNLRVLDFDQQGKCYEAFKADVPPEFFDRLVVETSQSGGRHIIFRTEEPLDTIQKLARDANGNTLIETLAEGKLFLCAPTPGYELIQGDFHNIPILKEQEAALLLDIACTFDEVETADSRRQTTADASEKTNSPGCKAAYSAAVCGLPSAVSTHPAADFNEKGRDFIKQFLRNHGWKYIRQDSINEYWQRPGKEHSKSHSATIKLDAPLFHVFSSNSAPFQGWKAYNFFQVYALLAHAGNESAATKDLARQGFGDPLLLQPVELPEFITTMPSSGENSETNVSFSSLPTLGRWDSIAVENYDEIDLYDIDDPGLIPDDLLHPPGLIGEIAGYNFDTNSVPQQEFALATGIAMTAHLIGKLYKTPDNLRSNIYIMSIGESGAGKDKAIEFLMNTQILNMDKKICNGFTGHAALLGLLRKIGTMLICWDELGVKMEAILSPRNTNINQILGCLTELYSAASRAFFPERKVADTEYNPIVEPHCCLYATGTYKSVFKTFTPAMIENGFVGRVHFFLADAAKEGKNLHDASPIPDSIIEHIKAWIKMSSAIPTQEPFSVFPEAKAVPYTDEAKRIFTHFGDQCRKAKKETDERLMCLWARSVQEAKKLALIYACSVSMDNPGIDANAATWACRLSEHLTLRKLYIANSHMAADEQGHLENDIVLYVKKQKTVTQTQLIHRFKHGVPKRLREEAIKNLLETGRLIRERMTVGKSRKQSTTFRVPYKKRNE